MELAALWIQEKYGRNVLCGSVVCMCVCVCVSSCVLYAYVSILSASIPILPANLSVSACVKSAQHSCVGCRHLSVNSSCFRSVFLCLSRCQADSQKCLQEERSHLSQLKGSPQRELRSPSISVGICDCQWGDKMASGQRSVLRQAGILQCADECCLEA